jgi:hypothetical protein
MRRTTALVITLTFPLLALASATAFGQSGAEEPPLKVRTELVNVDVLARQKATGRIVSNLGKEDFSVFEDGRCSKRSRILARRSCPSRSFCW